MNHSRADDLGTHLGPATETTARSRKRYFALVEVDVPAAGSGEEYDDALRRAYSTIGSQLWGDPFPDDATLDVGEVEDEQEPESETGDQREVIALEPDQDVD